MRFLKKEKMDFMDLVYKYHESMKKYNIIIVYEGEIDQSITKAFISLVEKNMNEDETESKVVRKVYHVMVEFLQNIHKHADSMDGDKASSSKGIFLLGKEGEGYVILSGNVVEKRKLPDLKDLLVKFNFMRQTEIKDFYQRKIMNEGLSDKGGAGLGFVDIIRRTGSKLEYRFENINDEYSFFILKTYIAK